MARSKNKNKKDNWNQAKEMENERKRNAWKRNSLECLNQVFQKGCIHIFSCCFYFCCAKIVYNGYVVYITIEAQGKQSFHYLKLLFID